MSNVIFDRRMVRCNRARSVATFAQHDFLLREMVERLADRLEDTTRRFPIALDIGSRGWMDKILNGRGGIETLVQADFSEDCLQSVNGLRVAMDEEFIPFADASFDLILISGSLHWVNDVPGALIQLARALKPDGMFIATMLGGETLVELRDAVTAAGMREGQGVAARISPFMDVKDAGSLLQRAGFALPVVDRERITARYTDALSLMKEVRGMGEANALKARLRRFTTQGEMLAIAQEYHRLFQGQDGRIPATFELLTLTGWKPDSAQPQPAKRGSGTISLVQALKD